MKIFVALFLLASASAELQTRVHGGKVAKRGEVPSFVSLQLSFGRLEKICGGVLAPPGDRIYTAATCVYEYTLFDGFISASRIRLAFNHNRNFGATNVTVKEKYFVGADLAVLLLDKPVHPGPNLKAATISTDGTSDVYVGKDVTACGFGFTDNAGNTPKTLKCTTLRVVPSSVCTAVMTPLQQFLMNLFTGFICTKNSDSRNVCGGDTGGALYLDGVAIGLVSFFPDHRPNAKCEDGHLTLSTQFGVFSTALQDLTKLLTMPDFPVHA